MKYLITGGTGSLGKALTKRLLEDNHEVIIYSRDEGKQADLTGPIKKVIGDVRDYKKINATMKIYQPDFVIHTAALKRVDDMELHPDECVRTNIEGSKNVALASLNSYVKKCILISTDKACQPVNVYGSTKFIAERMFTNLDSNSSGTVFTSVRYGNVIASRGSFIPMWKEKIEKEETIPVTAFNCTRFLFTLQDAVTTVLNALEATKGGEVFVPKIKSYSIGTVIRALERLVVMDAKTEHIGLRPGEKIHEDMLAETELPYTYWYAHPTGENDLLRIIPQYTNRNIKWPDRLKYDGKRMNSALHLEEDEKELAKLIDRGLKEA